LILVFLATGACSDQTPEGPVLEVSSWEGQLQSGQVGLLFLELLNNGSTYSVSGSPEAIKPWLMDVSGRAIDIRAELQSGDGEIEVFTPAQFAGALDAGAARQIEFYARPAEEAGPGVYPVQLVLSYRELVAAESSGQPADVAFQYRDRSLKIPLQVQVTVGARMELQPKGGLLAGREADLQMVLFNQGDQAAENVSIRPISQPPLSCPPDPIPLGDVPPAGSASAKLKLFSEKDTPPGYYALPCLVSYRSAGRDREVQMAALVEVTDSGWAGGFLLPALGLLAAAGLYLGYRRRKGR